MQEYTDINKMVESQNLDGLNNGSGKKGKDAVIGSKGIDEIDKADRK